LEKISLSYFALNILPEKIYYLSFDKASMIHPKVKNIEKATGKVFQVISGYL